MTATALATATANSGDANDSFDRDSTALLARPHSTADRDGTAPRLPLQASLLPNLTRSARRGDRPTSGLAE